MIYVFPFSQELSVLLLFLVGGVLMKQSLEAPSRLMWTNQAHERRSFFKAQSQPEPIMHIMHMKRITHQNVLVCPLKISIEIKLGQVDTFQIFFYVLKSTSKGRLTKGRPWAVSSFSSRMGNCWALCPHTLLHKQAPLQPYDLYHSRQSIGHLLS